MQLRHNVMTKMLSLLCECDDEWRWEIRNLNLSTLTGSAQNVSCAAHVRTSKKKLEKNSIVKRDWTSPLYRIGLDLDPVRWPWEVQLYTRVQDDKSQNRQHDTEQEMWKVLQHIFLLPPHSHLIWKYILLTKSSQHLHHQTFSSVMLSK